MQNVNLFADDRALSEATSMFGAVADWEAELLEFGKLAGSEAAADACREAHTVTPVLHNYDRSGRRIDQVHYTQGYHSCMNWAVSSRVPSLPWTARDSHSSHVARAALAAMQFQLEPGASCPLTMTFAAFPALSVSPSCSDWLPKLTSTVYDPRDVPASEKEGVILGMSMTESQGGSDVRANTTRATPLTSHTADGSGWALRGAKWFTSAPNSDAFLTLAKTGESDAVSCFLVPRWLPDGTRNKGFRVVRLKDKLGDKSNASSEVEYDNAWGQLVGEEGRGIATIMEMVVHTRLDCAIGSASIMRQSLRMAVAHCTQRAAFGTDLIRAPLMRAVLADVAVESEASILLAMQLAHWFGESRRPDGEASRSADDVNALRRLATAVAKFLICKRAPGVVAESLECMGGNGFDVRWDMERLYRQAPLNSLWEGSGNVQALDVLRTLQREPRALRIMLEELSTTSKDCGTAYTALLRDAARFANSSPDPATMQARARLLTETLGTLLQAHVLALKGDSLLLQAFVDTRLASDALGGLGSVAANTSYGCRSGLTQPWVDHVLERQLPTTA